MSALWRRREEDLVRNQFVFARRLDRGNPTPGNIGADFDRLGLSFWPAVRRLDSRTASRQQRLEQLCSWRNAIAHQDCVSFVFGLDRVVGAIIEDRGNIGFRGRRLLRVRVPRADTDDLVTEVPEENVNSA